MVHSVSPKKKKAADGVAEKVARALGGIGISSQDLILVGLSGGPDSVTLMHVLFTLKGRFGYRLAAAHLNHRLRGEESNRDEEFVRKLCRNLCVELSVEQAEGLAPAMANLEERARELRRDFLDRAADRTGASRIALAHHADDQAETVMLRLLRGSGIAGLGAMALAGPRRLIRPMLEISRSEILAYLEENRLPFAEDVSNRSPTFTRNRIRHHLFPELERDYASGLQGRLVELAREAREVDELLGKLAGAELLRRTGEAGELELAGFAEIHPAVQKVLLREFIARTRGDLRAIERSHIEAVCRLCLIGPSNGVVDLPGGIIAWREYAKLFVANQRDEQTAAPYAVTLAVPGKTPIRQAGLLFTATTFSAGQVTLPRTKSEALFDCDRVGAGLTVRNFAPGDRISPIGLGGSRKVKEVFIDYKLARHRRATFPLVVVGNQVAWLPGIARGTVALITPATVEVIRLTAEPLVACE